MSSFTRCMECWNIITDNGNGIGHSLICSEHIPSKETPTMRDLIIKRIQELRIPPFNGHVCFGSEYDQYHTDETFESFSDHQLVHAFEIICRTAYRQR
jgi:hypothetical protein